MDDNCEKCGKSDWHCNCGRPHLFSFIPGRKEKPLEKINVNFVTVAPDQKWDCVVENKNGTKVWRLKSIIERIFHYSDRPPITKQPDDVLTEGTWFSPGMLEAHDKEVASKSWEKAKEQYWNEEQYEYRDVTESFNVYWEKRNG